MFDENGVAVTAIPNDNAEYARERGWNESDREFSLSRIVATLDEQVAELPPRVEFSYELVDRFASVATIRKRLRNVAAEMDASMVFVGSDNAGRVVSALGSVGASVASDDTYDVVIVRRRSPAKRSKLRRRPPYRRSKSDCY
ncbi:MAG: universal stress protein [Halobacteriota archaeon]